MQVERGEQLASRLSCAKEQVQQLETDKRQLEADKQQHLLAIISLVEQSLLNQSRSSRSLRKTCRSCLINLRQSWKAKFAFRRRHYWISRTSCRRKSPRWTGGLHYRCTIRCVHGICHDSFACVVSDWQHVKSRFFWNAEQGFA